jgi:hypothetical protein
MFTQGTPLSARGDDRMAGGLIGFAPVYLNGVLALVWLFTMPGLLVVRAIDIVNFPLRLLAIILSSLTANYLLVVLIATLHLSPLLTYQGVVLVLTSALAFLTASDIGAGRAPFRLRNNGALLLEHDVRWLVFSLIVLGFAYFNIWRRGVPGIFGEGDLSISWNNWAMTWSYGLFPQALGYPQFIPTIWAATYIFTGSIEHYFAYYTYLALIILPIVLVCAYLAQRGWWRGLLPLLTFVWFVAELREGWHRESLIQGFPDWTAAVCGFFGIALFINNDPSERFDGERLIAAIVSLSMILLAAATKPIYWLFAIAVLLGNCLDAARHLGPWDRNRFVIAIVGLVALFAAAYLVIILHLSVRSLPGDPVSVLYEKLKRSLTLFNTILTPPFRIAVCAGLAVSSFLPRIRWLTLPLLLGIGLWATTASYDLRNLFGILLTCVFIAPFAGARLLAREAKPNGTRFWRVPDAIVAVTLAVIALAATLPLATTDARLLDRFNRDQMQIGAGAELNREVGQLLARGCFLLTDADYIYTIAAFVKYRTQTGFFNAGQPLPAPLARTFDEFSGCSAVLYSLEYTIAPTLDYIAAKSEQRGYATIIEAKRWRLLATP